VTRNLLDRLRGLPISVAKGPLSRFLRFARRLEGISGALPTQVSPDRTIALTRLQLDRPALDIPSKTAGG
jgi:hypothetical protein